MKLLPLNSIQPFDSDFGQWALLCPAETEPQMNLLIYTIKRDYLSTPIGFQIVEFTANLTQTAPRFEPSLPDDMNEFELFQAYDSTEWIAGLFELSVKQPLSDSLSQESKIDLQGKKRHWVFIDTEEFILIHADAMVDHGIIYYATNPTQALQEFIERLTLRITH